MHCEAGAVLNPNLLKLVPGILTLLRIVVSGVLSLLRIVIFDTKYRRSFDNSPEKTITQTSDTKH